ncbi:lytic transglycosylase domain-containing protein [Acidithiobacillus sp. MC6.1]|nr:lytic transglycosylase domain-containing protein [Acidithiobacillus sp. MC6.1]
MVLLLTTISTTFFVPGSPVECTRPTPISFATAPQPTASRTNAHREKARALVRHLAGPWTRMVHTAARQAHVSPRLIAAVIDVENHGDVAGSAHRVSTAGAIGPMQLMPNTAWNTLHVNPWIPRQNIDGGARFLHQLIMMFHGDIREALVAYNAGPTATARGFATAQSWHYADAVLVAEQGSTG